MSTPRAQHTATLLADGRVLIAGGRNGTNGTQDLASAELYDPSTDAFTPSGVMINLRGLHWATVLADGRVLMTGCAIPCNSAIAEFYDPATGSFADAGTPGAGGGAATLLTDGRVLIPGGCPADAELYDPVAGTFISLGHTIGPHEFSAATLIPVGTVLITGGQLPGGNGDSGAELYMSTTGTFALTGKMGTGRHTATLLLDGSVLVAGGYSLWPGATASAEIYRPSVLIPPPVLYSVSGDGRGQGAILHAGTAQIASPDRPGRRPRRIATVRRLGPLLTALSEATRE